MEPQLQQFTPTPSALRRADTATNFLADPIGASIAGRTFLVWVQSPDRVGAVHTAGRDSNDAITLASLFPIFVHPALSSRYDLVHDLGDIVDFDPEMYKFFERFLETWMGVFAARVRRVAVVRPTGHAGAAFQSLFHQWVAPRVDARLCDTRAEAYEWLGMTPDESGQIDAQRDDLAGPTTLRRVREAIANQIDTPMLSAIAGQLGLGARTLQRQLAGLGTSFRDEVIHVRIKTAKARLLQGNDKVESIARTVGFASTAAFSASFHNAVGITPTAFRARNQNG